MHEKQVLAVLHSLRAMDTIYPEDIAAICAALSAKVSTQTSSHPMMAAAVDSLDDLHIYIADYLGEV
jgi:hypothetical protein